MRALSSDNGHAIFTSNFSAAFSAHLGLRSIARARNMASAWPSMIILSACSGSVMSQPPSAQSDADRRTNSALMQ